MTTEHSHDTMENSPQTLSIWRSAALDGLSRGADVILNDVCLTDGTASGAALYQPLVGVSSDGDRAIVSAKWGGPLCLGITIARGLASDRVLSHIAKKCEDQSRSDPISSLSTERVQSTRCLGYLPDRVDDLSTYLDFIRDERRELMSRIRGDASRSEVLSEAHGLAGSVVHLLDMVGVEPVREIRLPNYTANIHRDGDGNRRRNDLLTYLGTAVPISARYGAISANRLLFEGRQDRRDQLPGGPLRTDGIPNGSHIGSWILTGHGTSRLIENLERRLSQPKEPMFDGDNFRRVKVPLTIDTDRRMGAFNDTVDSFESLVGLTTSDSTSRILAMIVQTPYTGARALRECIGQNQVGPEECLRAIGSLEQQWILPDGSPTQSAIIHTLLNAEEPISQSELAQRADVTPTSIRNNRQPLLDYDLVRWTNDGLILSFYDSGQPEFTRAESLSELLSQGPTPNIPGCWPVEPSASESVNLTRFLNGDQFPTTHRRIVPSIAAWHRWHLPRYGDNEVREAQVARISFGVEPLISAEGIDW